MRRTQTRWPKTKRLINRHVHILQFVIVFAIFGTYALLKSHAAVDIQQLNGLLGTDTNYFPIGVWLQTPTNNTTINGQTMTVAQAYANAGINLINNGSYSVDNAFMQAIQNAGQGVIEANQSSGLASSYKSLIKAWGQEDEVDNAQSNGSGGYDPCIAPSVIVDNYNNLKAADTTRPVLINFGQGVANTNWVGRGTCTGHTEMYAQYAAGADILSFDAYPVNDGYPLTYIADGVDNLRQWASDTKPVWAFIEATKFDTGNGQPTPAQVKAETWLALTHGARGIQYFVHIFTPSFIEAGLFTDPTMYNAVKANNLEIKNLAQQLNSPSVANGASVSSSLRIDKTVKQTGSDTYVFAVTPNNSSGNATFTVAGQSSGTVTVIDEGRTLNMTNGSFTDSFPAYGVHLYKISAAATPASSTYYVSQSGSDSHGCTNATSDACQTIDKAYQKATGGDTVLITGNLTASQTLNNHTQTLSSDVVIKPVTGVSLSIPSIDWCGADHVNMQGAITSKSLSTYGCMSSAATNVTIDGLTFDYQYDTSATDGAIISLYGNLDSWDLKNLDVKHGYNVKGIELSSWTPAGTTYYPTHITIEVSKIHDMNVQWQKLSSTNDYVHTECLFANKIQGFNLRGNHFYNCVSTGDGIIGNSGSDALLPKDYVFENNIFEQSYNGPASAGEQVGVHGVSIDGRAEQMTGTNVFRYNLFEMGMFTGSGPISGTTVEFYGNVGVPPPCSQMTTSDYNVWTISRSCKGAHDVIDANVLATANFSSLNARPTFAVMPAQYAAGDWHYKSASTMVGKGDSNNTCSSSGQLNAGSSACYPAIDKDGNTRPASATVDAGPYEYGGSSGSGTKTGDFNSDGVVNIYDLGIFLSKWQSTTSITQDLNNDGIVNIYDLGAFLSHYGT